MVLAGYILVPGSHFGGMWRHPYSEVNFCDRTLYEGLARTLERGFFDMAFVPESLSVATGYNDDFETFLKYGAVGAVRLDPSHVVNAMIGVTRHLGFTITMSTTFMEPYHIARIFSTLNHFSDGRVAWNVVTSAGGSNAHNFEHLAVPDHGGLYDRASEVLELCRALWQSWEPDALVLDKERGEFADPRKVHSVGHRGRFFQVRGPLSLPHAPGGGPVLMMAGVSPRGRDFAARWADSLFAIQSDIAGMRELRNDIRRRAADLGRDAEKIKLLAAVQPIIGETTAIAAARADFLDQLLHPEMSKAFFSAMLGIDLSAYDLSTPLTDVLAELEQDSSRRGAVDAGTTIPWLRRILEDNSDQVTVGEIARMLSRSSSTPRLIGTAREIADQLQEIFLSEACDGFVVTPTHFPGTFEEFARAVVPELQRRELLRHSYAGVGLRQNLEL